LIVKCYHSGYVGADPFCRKNLDEFRISFVVTITSCLNQMQKMAVTYG